MLPVGMIISLTKLEAILPIYINLSSLLRASQPQPPRRVKCSIIYKIVSSEYFGGVSHVGVNCQ